MIFSNFMGMVGIVSYIVSDLLIASPRCVLYMVFVIKWYSCSHICCSHWNALRLELGNMLTTQYIFWIIITHFSICLQQLINFFGYVAIDQFGDINEMIFWYKYVMLLAGCWWLCNFLDQHYSPPWDWVPHFSSG